MPEINQDTLNAIDYATGDLQSLFECWGKIGGAGCDGNLDAYLYGQAHEHVQALAEAVAGRTNNSGTPCPTIPKAGQSLTMTSALDAYERAADLAEFLAEGTEARTAAEKLQYEAAAAVYALPVDDFADLLAKLALFEKEEEPAASLGVDEWIVKFVQSIIADVRRCAQ